VKLLSVKITFIRILTAILRTFFLRRTDDPEYDVHQIFRRETEAKSGVF